MKVQEAAAAALRALIEGNDECNALDVIRNLALREAEDVAAMVLNDADAVKTIEGIVCDPLRTAHHLTLDWLSHWYTSRASAPDTTSGVSANKSAIGLLFISFVPAAIDTLLNPGDFVDKLASIEQYLVIVYNTAAPRVPVPRTVTMNPVNGATQIWPSSSKSSLTDYVEGTAGPAPATIVSIDASNVSSVVECLSHVFRTYIWSMPEPSMLAYCVFAKSVVEKRKAMKTPICLDENCYMVVATILHVCLFSEPTMTLATDCLKALEELAEYEMYGSLFLVINALWKSNHYMRHYKEIHGDDEEGYTDDSIQENTFKTWTEPHGTEGTPTVSDDDGAIEMEPLDPASVVANRSSGLQTEV